MDQQRCVGERIDDDDDAEEVHMWMVYDPTATTYEIICDGDDYCAWGYRIVGVNTTKFYCSWTDDRVTQA